MTVEAKNILGVIDVDRQRAVQCVILREIERTSRSCTRTARRFVKS